MPTAFVNGVNLHYEWHGPAGGQVLVLSNGVLMSTASWVFQTRVLARHYRLLLYDCRGMWQSEHPPGPYSMEMHAADLGALLDELGVEKAHIGGTSYGAEIGMVFALKYPDRVRKLIVTSAVSQLDPILEGIARSWLLAAEKGDPEMLYRTVAPLIFSEWWMAENKPLLEEARIRYQSLDMAAFQELMRCFLSLDVTADLQEIQAPTLVAVGEADILKPRRYSELIADRIPNSELAVIPRAAHAAMWEQPSLFNALILGFLGS
jgi:3-oxoadipate enol-lactonase